MTITPHHRSEFTSLGITKVDGLIPRAKALKARELMLQMAEKHDLYTSAGWRRSNDRFSNINTFRAALKTLKHSNQMPNFINAGLLDAAQQLTGDPVTPLPPGQQILFTLPGAESWSVPNDVWHVDIPRLGDLGPPGMQMFTFLNEARPKGGATLVLAGSHHLMNDLGVLKSKELKQHLAKEAYFQSLFDPQRTPITDLADTKRRLGNVELKVVELAGQIGDVYFMDLRALHTPSPNMSDTARAMITCRLPRTSIAEYIGGPKAAVF